MYTKTCIVCGQNIGFFGWANHVNKEKRLHGEGVYRHMRIAIRNEQDKPNPQPIKVIDTNNKKLADFV